MVCFVLSMLLLGCAFYSEWSSGSIVSSIVFLLGAGICNQVLYHTSEKDCLSDEEAERLYNLIRELTHEEC